MRNDQTLVQIVDAALAEAARKAGDWLVCRPGCFACCIGLFALSPLDAERLRRGLRELEAADHERAARVVRRAAESWERLKAEFPVDTIARLLEDDDAGEHEPCPALDPTTGTCDLYAHRPLTCRMFGPPVRFDGASLAVCELCFDGASPEQVAACEVEIDPQIESELLEEFAGQPDTIVAAVLLPAAGCGADHRCL